MMKEVLIKVNAKTGHIELSDNGTGLDVNEIMVILINTLITTCKHYDEDPRDFIMMMLDAFLEDEEE